MKKYLILIISMSLIFSLSSTVSAGWQLYDNFDSGTIATQKWTLDDSSASISIENGEAKFVHNAGYPNDSSWLEIIDNPENITGIRTKIRVQSCTGDVQGRIGGWVGKIEENPLFFNIGAKSDNSRIEINVGVNSPNYEYLYNLFGGAFFYNSGNPLDFTGKTYTIEWMFSSKEVNGAVEGQGGINYKYPNIVSPYESSFKGIGTRSNAGNGPCTIYFDDVYVYRQIPSPATNLLLLEEQ
jgi:hypothetical protein